MGSIPAAGKEAFLTSLQFHGGLPLMTHSFAFERHTENLAKDFTIDGLPAVGLNDKGSGMNSGGFLEILFEQPANAPGGYRQHDAHSPETVSTKGQGEVRERPGTE